MAHMHGAAPSLLRLGRHSAPMRQPAWGCRAICASLQHPRLRPPHQRRLRPLPRRRPPRRRLQPPPRRRQPRQLRALLPRRPREEPLRTPLVPAGPRRRGAGRAPRETAPLVVPAAPGQRAVAARAAMRVAARPGVHQPPARQAHGKPTAKSPERGHSKPGNPPPGSPRLRQRPPRSPTRCSPRASSRPDRPDWVALSLPRWASRPRWRPSRSPRYAVKQE